MDGEPPAQGAERVRWASIRAGNLYWGLERTAEAEEVLQQAAVGEEGGEEAVAMLAWILLFDGRLPEAVAVAGRVLDRPEVPAQALVWAATAAVPALGSLGRLGEALAVADRGLAVAEVHPRDLPWGETQLNLVRCQVLLGAGRLTEASAIADAGYQAAVTDRSSERTGVGPASGAWSPRPRAGSRPPRRGCGRRSPCWMSRIPIGSCAGVWPNWPAWPPWPVIRRRRWAGWSARTPAPERPTATDPWVELDKAWVAAGAGELTRAVALATRAADMARASKQLTLEAAALYDVARLGARPPSGSGWRSWLACWRVGWRRCWPARRSRWPPTMGRPWIESGPPSRTWGPLAGSRGKGSGGPGSPPPGATPAPTPPRRGPQPWPASARALAPGPRPGHASLGAHAPRGRWPCWPAQASSREIATRLDLSVRTVDNYLGRVYAKLGVSSRARLATLLEVRHRGRRKHGPILRWAGRPLQRRGVRIGRSGGHISGLRNHQFASESKSLVRRRPPGRMPRSWDRLSRFLSTCTVAGQREVARAGTRESTGHERAVSLYDQRVRLIGVGHAADVGGHLAARPNVGSRSPTLAWAGRRPRAARPAAQRQGIKATRRARPVDSGRRAQGRGSDESVQSASFPPFRRPGAGEVERHSNGPAECG